jgi:hypothetical protein
MVPREFGQAMADFQKAVGSDNFEKAISITQPTSPGLTSREDLQDNLVIAGPMDAPLQQRLSRIEGNGEAHAFWRLSPNTDMSQGFFYGTTPGNGVFPRGGLPVSATENYERVALPYYNLGDLAKVPWQSQREARSFADLMAQRVKVKARNVILMENYFDWWGDSSITTFPGGGRIWDGLIKQLRTGGSATTIPSNGQISIGLIRQLHKKMVDNGGSPSCNFCDTLGKAIISAQVTALYAIRSTGGKVGPGQLGLSIDEYDFGYGSTPIIWDRYLVPDNGAGGGTPGTFNWVTIDEHSQDQMNETGNTICMVDVDPLHSNDLAQIDTSWQKVIFLTSMMMVTVPQFHGIAQGITYAGQNEITG